MLHISSIPLNSCTEFLRKGAAKGKGKGDGNPRDPRDPRERDPRDPRDPRDRDPRWKLSPEIRCEVVCKRISL